jgi:YihY family inner membrane protein
MSVLGRLDAYQRRHRRVAFALGVVYKFIDDQGTYLAALITYYGFLSLLLVTALSFALRGDVRLQQEVLHSALSQFPVIGDQVAHNVHSFQGSGFALCVGVAGSLYGALGVAQAIQNAFNTVWAVPQHRRPTAVAARLRGLALLGLLGLAVGASSASAAVTATAHGLPAWLEWGVRAGCVPASVALDTALLLLGFKLLTGRHLRVRLLWPEALAAALAWQALLAVGAYYVGHVLRGATATYGLFGIVLGLMAWIYVGALTLVVCAESTAVRTLRLWPRGITAPFTDDAPLTGADRRAYTSYATAAAFKPYEDIRVAFRRSAAGRSNRRPPAGT